MSKTTIVSNTKNVRSTNTIASDGSSHHVITKGENRRQLKDNTSSNTKQGRGYGLDESSKGRSEKRISIRNGPSTSECNRSKVKIEQKSNYDRTFKGSKDEVPVEYRNVTTAAENQLKAANESEAKQKLSLIDYYAQRGTDYRLVRKNCKIRVNGEGSGSKSEPAMYIDFYQIPEGYSAEDLPDSQGMTIQSQNTEDPISPAVIIAAQHRKERVKLTEAPETNSDEIIRRIQMGRRCKKRPDARSVSTSEDGPNRKQRQSEIFPDTSLNDSDLIMASQMVERDLGIVSSESPVPKDAFKRDINGNSKYSSPFNPMTSTPLANVCKNPIVPVEETPKTARAVSRSRNRSHTQTSMTEMFENSVSEDTEELGNFKISEDDDAPRKILKFDESPIKNVIAENVSENQEIEVDDQVRSGEFDDDNEDALFSQINIPGEIREPRSAVFENSTESFNSQLNTQIVDQDSYGKGNNTDIDCGEMDSFLDADALDAIAKLEAVHCTGNSSTGNSIQTRYDDGRKTERRSGAKGALQKETPRTKNRRPGLSRKVAVN